MSNEGGASFDAFGAQIASTGTTSNPYLYSGERFDSSLNLYHLRARYYNMLTGRYETMDPGPAKSVACCVSRASQVGDIFDPATLHKYVYTKNNPVNWTDPSGRGIEDYAGLTFEDIVRTYAGVKNIQREAALALCFDAAAVYAVQYPDASVEEILFAEALCMSKLGF